MEKTTQTVDPYDDVEEEGSESDESPHKLPKKQPRKKRQRNKLLSPDASDHIKRQDSFS